MTARPSSPRVLMVCGPTKVGKSTTIDALVSQHGYHFGPAHTTRAPRSGERQGDHYYFTGQRAFHELVIAQFFVDWDYFLGNYYGIERASFLAPTRSPCVMHVGTRMALRLQARYDHAVSVFLYPADAAMVFDRIKRDFADPVVQADRCRLATEELLHVGMFTQVVRVEPGMSVAEVAEAVLSMF